MATLEQVEKLRQRANVTYDEAREALTASDDDLLEAMIYLEKQGKVRAPENGGCYSTRQEPPAQGQAPGDGQLSGTASQAEGLGSLLRRFGRWLMAVIRKGNLNSLEVWQGERRMMSVPVTVLVVLLVFCFWVVVPLMVVGLFCGCRYRFQGAEAERTGVNSVMDSAATAADNLKREVAAAREEHHDR